jgi:hypothetical protein
MKNAFQIKMRYLDKKMTSARLIIILTLLSHFSFGQDEKECEKIIISDSLFYKECSPFNFYKIKLKRFQDINNVMKIENNCLKFMISYGGCKTVQAKLVTNGVLQQDKKRNNFYLVKLYLVVGGGCERLNTTNLSFDVSQLKKENTTIYLKYLGFDQLIRYN